MLGQAVNHIRYGAGRVTAFEPPRVEVTFDDGAVRTFAYPQAVGRFLRFADEAAQRRAEQDRQDGEALSGQGQMEQLLARRRRAEAIDRQRLEAIREKRVATARRNMARAAMAREKKEAN